MRDDTLDKLIELLEHIDRQEIMITAILSQLRIAEENGFTKVVIKPVMLKQKLNYQLTYHYKNKVTHENIPGGSLSGHLKPLFEQTFRQAQIFTSEADFQILISKKHKVSILKKSATKKPGELTHNRTKKYILDEGTPVPFLVELGIMNSEGKVLAKKYDKFRQINRFLEMVQDVLLHLPTGRPLTIIDFGCGKSYLTFALYHYLAIELQKELKIVGLDLKSDVIEHCGLLANKLNYPNLRFLVGDIADYDEWEQVDMVVTLHACDTATDAALEKAVRWNASVILSVPCCQHELFDQIQQPVLDPLLSHGILKERFSALATDAIRAKLLDLMGYKTQLLEFIDMEHTPKNILIRAVKSSGGDRDRLWQEYMVFRDFLGASPYLERACRDLLPMM